MEELPWCEMSSSSVFFHGAAGSVLMQNAPSDVFFNSCLNQKEKYLLRLELDSGARWLRVPELTLVDVRRSKGLQKLQICQEPALNGQ